MSRADKLRALSHDAGTTEGERQAAAAALQRHELANQPPPPEKHTKEWFRQVGKFQRRVSELHVKIAALMPLGNPPLTWDEYKVLKNIDRSNGANPFNPVDVRIIETAEKKLAARSSGRADEIIALAHEPKVDLK
jgi:hypothetical protein